MNEDLQQLVALQKLDTSIRKLQTELEAIPQRRAEIENEFDQRAFEIRSLENQRDDARHARMRLETEVGEQKQRVERAERNLMSSKRPDEYTAAIREADAARKQISALETQILEHMETLDKAEGSLGERAEEIASLNSDREARLTAFDEETKQQADKLAHHRSERDQLVTSLTKETAALYARISKRIRDGVAVAEARNGSCTACFMALRPQMMAEVRRGEKVITCDNCNRILYYVSSNSTTANTPQEQPKMAHT